MENKYDGTQNRLESTLHFEYNLAPVQDSDQTNEKNKSSNLCVIYIPDLHLQKEDDLGILKQCIDNSFCFMRCHLRVLGPPSGVQECPSLLQDKDPSHMHLVSLAVKTLQKLMDYSRPAVSLFKDLGGVELLSQRLHVEVQRVVGVADSLTSVIASDTLKLEDDHFYSQKLPIKALLKALGSATYSPANPACFQSSNDNSLPMSLSLIFQNVGKFAGDIYISSVTVTMSGPKRCLGDMIAVADVAMAELEATKRVREVVETELHGG
ncbi:hypothetical protein TRIUR3_07712 [Triticum urartu]|uniref:Uncharacterized protein n=1 Tax=Triticum urartu TaxID=4572 RepID=M7Z0C9_TRIUA|nr:hypothetical protein TRIUR3_07712 [Triticum urartu]